jgi:hypothetical protein
MERAPIIPESSALIEVVVDLIDAQRLLPPPLARPTQGNNLFSYWLFLLSWNRPVNPDLYASCVARENMVRSIHGPCSLVLYVVEDLVQGRAATTSANPDCCCSKGIPIR